VRKISAKKRILYLNARGTYRVERLPPKLQDGKEEEEEVAPIGPKSLDEVDDIIRGYMEPLRDWAVAEYGEELLQSFTWGKYAISFEMIIQTIASEIWSVGDHSILESVADLLPMIIFYLPKKYGYIAALLCYKYYNQYHIQIDDAKLLLTLYKRTNVLGTGDWRKELPRVWESALKLLQTHSGFVSRSFSRRTRENLTVATLVELSSQIEKAILGGWPTPRPVTHMNVLQKECHENARLLKTLNPDLTIYHGSIGQRHYEFSPKPRRDMSSFHSWLPVLLSLTLKGDREWEGKKRLSMKSLIKVAQANHAVKKLTKEQVELARLFANSHSHKTFLSPPFTKAFMEALEPGVDSHAEGGLGDLVDHNHLPLRAKKFLKKGE
jgi:hypothetical protein